MVKITWTLLCTCSAFLTSDVEYLHCDNCLGSCIVSVNPKHITSNYGAPEVGVTFCQILHTLWNFQVTCLYFVINRTRVNVTYTYQSQILALNLISHVYFHFLLNLVNDNITVTKSTDNISTCARRYPLLEVTHSIKTVSS